MFEHEFYADPTVFDQWQNSTGHWFGSGLAKLSPFSWALGFCGLAAVFLFVAIGVFIASLQQSGQGDTLVLWNQVLAQGLTIIIALTASNGLFKQAMQAWPRHISVSDALRGLAGFPGVRNPQPAELNSVADAPSKTTVDLAADRRAVQEFFTGVRAAGVNVAIAKALFKAGVRTAEHLNNTEDSALCSICGVGPATVRKLRGYFEQQ